MHSDEVLKYIDSTLHTLEFLRKELSVLKKEFEDSGASLSSARKGTMSEEDVKGILKKRKKALMKKAT